MKIIIIGGFMDVGKTTYIKELLKHSRKKALVIQFEDGDEEFTQEDENSYLAFTREDVKDISRLVSEIDGEAQKDTYDWMIVEWNGMMDMQIALDIFMSPAIRAYGTIEHVLYLLDEKTGPIMLGQTGLEPVSQIINADYVLITGKERKKEHISEIKQVVKTIQPEAKVYTSSKKVSEKLEKRKSSSLSTFYAVLIVAAAYIFLAPYVELLGFPLNQWMVVLTAILLEGIPFLLLGTFVSAMIQVLIPDGYLEKIYPKKTLWGILTAVVVGFFIPVCDCAIVPVAKGFIKKGVPFGAAITFMVVTPIVNPIVIMSTYFAFNGNLMIVGVRLLLGILCGVIIGGILSLKNTPVELKGYSYDSICRNCIESKDAITKSQKFFAILKQTEDEFYGIVKYLILGAVISASIQVLGGGVAREMGAWPIPVLLVLFMVFAFFVSMCSTSDAVVAKSFLNQFSAIPVMAFMIFGPMMDVKNYFMLSNSFSKKTVRHIVVVIFGVCLSVCLLFYLLGGEALL